MIVTGKRRIKWHGCIVGFIQKMSDEIPAGEEYGFCNIGRLWLGEEESYPFIERHGGLHESHKT